MALIALVFTFLSIKETNAQTQISQQGQTTSEQGQITDRYNAAVTNLGSTSIDVRLGGIYALQRIMQDSPRDQPTVVAVLCAFVRDNAREPKVKSTVPGKIATDVEAALSVVVTRNTAHDGYNTATKSSNTVVDLSGAELSGVGLTGANLSHVNLSDADLRDAFLLGANLSGAALDFADLTGTTLEAADAHQASFISANLTDADLNRTNLYEAFLSDADLEGAYLDGTDLTHTSLFGANLKGAHIDTKGQTLNTATALS